MRTLLLAVLLSASAPGPAFAAFDDLGAGGRAPGMGDAVTAIADDVYATHYNPAGLGQLERLQVGLAYSKLYMGLSDGSDLSLNQLALAKPLSRGRKGTLGLNVQMFSLGGIYSENTLGFAYGRQAWSRGGSGKLFLGLNAKYLTHSVTPGPEGADAFDDTFARTGRPDPVLAAAKSKSAMDFDIGALFLSANRWSAGLAIKHLMEPNVSFSGDSDKLARKINLGMAYRALWMKLAGDVAVQQSAAGSQDKDITFAAERDFPTLDYGQFAVRGSLGFGTRGYRRLTMGGTYRINKIQFDYAVQLPLGGIKQTMGNHRIGLTFHFGSPTPEEQYSSELLSQLKRLRQRAEGLGYDFTDVSRPANLADQSLEPVMALIRQGKFREANRALLALIDTLPPKPELFHLARRLDLVAAIYPEIVDPKAKWEVLAASGTRLFLAGGDKEAAFVTSYAASLNRQEYRIDRLSAKICELTQTEVPRPARGRNLLQELQARSDEAYRAGDYAASLEESRNALVIEPSDTVSLQRVGTNHYMVGRYDEAIKAWKAALEHVTGAAEVDALRLYIQRAGNAKTGKLPPPAVERAKTAPAPAAKREAEKKPAKAEPIDVEKLFQAGLEFYARGDLVQALDKFRKVLSLDPGNVPARKAIERIGRSR